MRNAKVQDYSNLVNALQHGNHVPARASYELKWTGKIKVDEIRDETNQFAGEFIEDTATIEWSAHEEGFKFVSDPADTSTTKFAEIGREHNGVFFSDDD